MLEPFSSTAGLKHRGKGDALTLTFSGDLCPSDGYEDCFSAGSVDQLMPEVINKLAATDLHIANLELPLSSRGEPIIKCGPNFRAAPETVNGLKQLQISHACLANNHINDFGETALLDTVEHLESGGIKALGVAKGEDAVMEPHFFEQNGVRVCLINAAEAEFATPTRNCWGASALNEVAIINLLHAARTRADVIFLLLHAGREYCFFPATFLRKMYRNFIDNGADAIIAHHPHVPQGIEIYKGKLICYSLGNLIFDRPGMRKKTGPEFTFLLNCATTRSGVVDYAIVPLEKNPDNTITLLRENRKERFAYFMRQISEPLYDEDLAERIWDEYVRENIVLYMPYLAKAYNAYPFNQGEKDDEHKAYLLNVHASCLSHKKMLEKIIRLLRDDNTRPDKYAVNQISNWKHILDKLRKKPDILCPIN